MSVVDEIHGMHDKLSELDMQLMAAEADLGMWCDKVEEGESRVSELKTEYESLRSELDELKESIG